MRVLEQRRVPERHDGIAHELVDSAALGEDDVGQRREQPVEEGDQLLRRQPLGDVGEAAHVGEQHRHLARLAAELQLVVVARQLLDQRRGDVMSEGGAHAAALALGGDVAGERGREIDEQHGDRGVDRIEQVAGVGVGEPGRGEDDDDGGGADGRGTDGAERGRSARRALRRRRRGRRARARWRSGGRLRWSPLNICSSAWACTSTPGTAESSGVARRSSRPTALVPMMISRPAISLASIVPSRTRWAEM